MTLRGPARTTRNEIDPSADGPAGSPQSIRRSKSRSSQHSTPAKLKRSSVPAVYRLADLAVDTGITDLAREHDHYAYGAPKKGAAKPARRTAKGRRK